MATAAFHALVDEYIAGYPVRGHMISHENVKFTAAKLLLQKSNAAKEQRDIAEPAAAPKFAACLFVLFVQEHLVHSLPTILGTRAQEVYSEIQSVIRGANMELEALEQAMAEVDLAGTATALLAQPGIADALWGTEDIEALWASAAGGALQAVDEMTVYSDYDLGSEMLGDDYDEERGDHSMSKPPPTNSVFRRRTVTAGEQSSSTSTNTTSRRAAKRSDVASKRFEVELVLTEGPTPQQAMLSRRFVDAALEDQFRAYFFEVWGVWLRRGIYGALLITVAINFVYFVTSWDGFPNTSLAADQRADATTALQDYPGFIGDTAALGHAFAIASMVLPLVWSAGRVPTRSARASTGRWSHCSARLYCPSLQYMMHSRPSPPHVTG